MVRMCVPLTYNQHVVSVPIITSDVSANTSHVSANISDVIMICGVHVLVPAEMGWLEQTAEEAIQR